MAPRLLQAARRAAAPARAEDDPARDIRLGIVVAALFGAALFGWGSVARLDAAAYAPGRVAVAGHRQSVQHRDGGTVGAIYVAEGERVREGQVLLQLADAEVDAQASALVAQVIGLQAQRARLQAEQAGLAAIPWPAEFAALSGAERQRAEAAMAVQDNALRARAGALASQKGVLRQRSGQIAERAEGYRRQVEAAERQQALIGEELEGMKALEARGFAPKNRVRALERAEAELSGQREQYRAGIAESGQAVGETRLQMVALDKARSQEVADQLRDADSQLNVLAPRLAAARQQLRRTQVRAPAAGAVVGLSVHTVGGVIAPGQKLMDIVPERAGLVIEAQVSPDDADDLKVGQVTEVRFPSVRERGVGIIQGRISRISADSFIDEKTGAAYFTAEVTASPRELDKLARVKGAGFALRPGLPVEVLAPLHRRTALQYLLEPLTGGLWRSFREH